jgi:hypothetical protein
MVKRVIADIVYSGPVRGYAQILPFGARRLASYHRFSGFFCKVRLPDNWSTQPYLILAMRPSADVGYFSNCAAS